MPSLPIVKPLSIDIGVASKMASVPGEWNLLKQGAEARIYSAEFYTKPVIVKQRFSKTYRHPSLDEKLTHRRTTQEVRSMLRCRKAGIATPAVFFVDYKTHSIYMELIQDSETTRDYINRLLKAQSEESKAKLKDLAQIIGTTLASIHKVDCIHGDLTTSNMLHKTASGHLVLIDFGLSFISTLAEDKGVDLYVLERAFLSSHPNTEDLFQVVLESYQKNADKADEVLKKLDEVRLRGRKRTMVG